MIITGLIVGIALGVIMQRGRFCVTGMIRDVWLSGSYRNLVALFIVISVHAVGLAALTSAGIIAPDYSTFAPAAVIIGGFLFGLGIILAGGCASGTWYRSGEGLVGSWAALITYGVSAAAMKYGPLAGFNDWLKSWDTGWTTLPAALGVSPWIFAVVLSIGTVIAARYFLILDASRPRASLSQAWYARPLHMYAAGTAIGLLGVIAWPLSAATGRNDGLGITTPTADVLTYATTDDPARLNWGTMLVIGLLLGAFLAAKVTGEFRVRVPDATTVVKSVWGGILMGIGAALASGCTVGNGMVETSLFSFKGWVALGAIALGVGAGTKLWIAPSASYAAQPAQPEAGGVAITLPVATGLIAVPVAPAATLLTKIAEHRYYLDTMGKVCPFPLVDAKEAMDELADGEEMVIGFDCTQATDSIPQWAADHGHEVTEFSQDGDAGWSITLRKNAVPVS